MVLPPCLLAALCWLLPILGAWTDSWASIENAARTVTTVQAQFEQTKDIQLLSKPLMARGRFYFRRSGELRWEYSEPIKSVLLHGRDGVRRMTWRNGRYEPDAGTKVKPVQAVVAEMVLWLRGDFTKSTLFVPHLEPGLRPRIRLEPKDKAAQKLLTAVYVVLSPTPGVVECIEIWEGPEAVTRISLKNVKINRPIPDSLFRVPS